MATLHPRATPSRSLLRKDGDIIWITCASSEPIDLCVHGMCPPFRRRTIEADYLRRTFNAPRTTVRRQIYIQCEGAGSDQSERKCRTVIHSKSLSESTISRAQLEDVLLCHVLESNGTPTQEQTVSIGRDHGWKTVGKKAHKYDAQVCGRVSG